MRADFNVRREELEEKSYCVACVQCAVGWVSTIMRV